MNDNTITYKELQEMYDDSRPFDMFYTSWLDMIVHPRKYQKVLNFALRVIVRCQLRINRDRGSEDGD